MVTRKGGFKKMVDLGIGSVFEDVRKPSFSLAGAISTVSNVLIILFLLALGLFLFKGTIVTIIVLLAVALGFMVTYFLVIKKYLAGEVLTTWDYAIGIIAPVIIILLSPSISNFLLSGLPFSLYTPTASISGLQQLNSAPTPIQVNGLTATFLPTIILFGVILVILLAYKQKNNKVM